MIFNITRRTFLIIVLVQVANLPDTANCSPLDLRVMSFNIRYSRGTANEAKPENNWTDAKYPRRERTIRVIRENMPDILGVQEARDVQIVDLREALPEYEFYGVGRDDGKTGGEYAGIYYLKDRFKRLDAGSFWLSATPEKPGTTFFKSPTAVPRMASWVRLRDKPSGQEFLVLNTHWDHISGSARRQSAQLIRQRLESLGNGIPMIVMGDLNTPEDSPATATLIGPADSDGIRLFDSYRKLHPKRSPEESTFNDWNGRTAGLRIDFILHSDHFTPASAEILRTSYDGRWPSDHYPVTATLRLTRDAK